jgi:hypothetical protein
MNKGLISTENVTGLSQRNAKEFGRIIVKKFTDFKFSSLNLWRVWPRSQIGIILLFIFNLGKLVNLLCKKQYAAY